MLPIVFLLQKQYKTFEIIVYYIRKIIIQNTNTNIFPTLKKLRNKSSIKKNKH